MDLRRLRWIAVVAPTGFVVAVAVARHFLVPTVLGTGPGLVLEIGLALLGALCFAYWIFGSIERAERRLALQTEQLFRRAQTAAILDERDRLAREMHDSVAQVLGYVNIKGQAAQQFLARGDTARAIATIDELGEAARGAYADVREEILGLKTSPTPERGLAGSLDAYVRTWEEQSGVEAHLNCTALDGVADLDGQLAEVQLVRIVQEALSNVRKHAHARTVQISAAKEAGWVEVAVQDDGVGFDPAHLSRGQFPRFGLATMQERAEAVGGSLQIDSGPGRGTQVRVRVPVGAPEEAELSAS